LKNPNPPQIAYELTVVERKSGQQKAHVSERIAKVNAGNPVVPLGLKLPVASLDPGSYRVELRALDTAGNISKTRSTDFEVE
jgi:antitoxin (DNA-binding transcriptional repressor) of toxin-antitoxin stability system